MRRSFPSPASSFPALDRLAAAMLAVTFAPVSVAQAHEPILAYGDAPRAEERLQCVIEGTGDGVGLVVTLSGESFEFILDLRPSTVAAAGAPARRRTDAGPVATSNATNLYRGVIAGVAGSLAALTVDGGSVDGLVRAGRELFLLAPVESDACEVDLYRFSALADDLPVARALRDMLDGSAASEPSESDGVLQGDQPFVLEYAAVGDYEWFQRWGAASISRMQSVVNGVDVIFVDQMNVTVEVTHSEVFETAGDPFSEFNSGNLFANFRDAATEFGEWRDDEGGAVEAAGLAHLFSDKALGLTSGGAGFGFIDTLCDADRGVSISTTRFFNSVSFSSLILAHEIGHNFGAPHDGEGACSNAPAGFIMATAATGSQFSDCSKDIMSANAEGAACILEGQAPPCAQPTSAGTGPTATDCLFILSAAVAISTCDPECVCAPTGTLPISASDALLCLQSAVGGSVQLNCPC